MRKALYSANEEISLTSSPYTFESDYYGLYVIQPEPYVEFNLLGNKSDYKFLDVGTGKFFSTDYGSGLSLSTTKSMSTNTIKFIGSAGSSAGNIISRKLDSISSSATLFVSAYIRKDSGAIRLACGSTDGGSEYGYETIATGTSFARYSLKCTSVNPDTFYLTVRKTDTSVATVYIDGIVVIDLTGKELPEALQTKYSAVNYSDLTDTQLEEIFGATMLQNLVTQGYVIPEIDGAQLIPGNEIIMASNAPQLSQTVYLLDFSESEVSADTSGEYMHIYIENYSDDASFAIDSMGRVIKKVSSPATRGIDYTSGVIEISLLMSQYGLTDVDSYDARRVLNGWIKSGANWAHPQTLATATASDALNTQSSRAFLIYTVNTQTNTDIDASIIISELSGTFDNIYLTPALTLYPAISGFSVRDINNYGIRKHRHIYSGNTLLVRDSVAPYYWDYSSWDSCKWN